METTDVKSLRQPWQGQLARFAPYILSGLILVILPPLLPAYVQSLMTKILIFAIFAVSLDIIWGYTGLISLGHAAYFGLGGYTAGVLMMHYGIKSFWISAPLGILVAVLGAAVFGLIALRLYGIYFLLITVAIGQLLFSLAWKWRWLSSPGAEGIVGITRPSIGLPFTWNFLSFYYFVFLVFVICFFLLYRLVKSPFGQTLRGIREDEPRMRVLGVNTWLHRYIAFIIAGAFAGIAGVLFAYHNGIIVPEHFAIGVSTLALLIVIIGGVGTLFGPVIGAAVIIPVEFYAGIITPERWPLILGGIFVISIMYFRDGIGAYLSRFWEAALSRWKY